MHFHFKITIVTLKVKINILKKLMGNTFINLLLGGQEII